MKDACGFFSCLLVVGISGCGSSSGPVTELRALAYSGYDRPPNVSCLALSTDGKLLAVGTRGKPGSPWQGEVILWETATWKERASLACDQFVRQVALSPDGNWLAASCFTDWGQNRKEADLKRAEATGFKGSMPERLISPQHLIAG